MRVIRIGSAGLVIAVMASLLAGMTSTAAGAQSSGAKVLFVAGGTTLPAADLPLRARLVASGHTVTIADDDTVTLAAAAVVDLVVISSSVVPTTLAAKLKASTTPMVVGESYVFDDLGMSTGAVGDAGSYQRVAIVDPTHPAAAGRSGLVTVAGSLTPFAYGTPGPAAKVVASLEANPARAALFTYDAGAALVGGGTAAGRRAGIFFSYATPPTLGTSGWALFDATVAWALGDGVVTPPGPPVVDAGPDRTVTLPATASLTGTVTAPLPAVVAWSQVSGPTGATIASPAAATTNVSFTQAGAYSFRLSATDATHPTVSDTVNVTVNPAAPGPGPGPGPAKILFVAGFGGIPVGDVPAVNRLRLAGHSVTVVDDDNLKLSDTFTVNLVVISSSVVPATVGTLLTDVALPIVTWEPLLHDELRLTAGASATYEGEVAAQRQVTITNPSHPLAAGLTGSVNATGSTSPFSYGVPAGGGSVIATLAGQPTRAAVFAFEQGAARADGSPAPARRVGLFPSYATPSVLSPVGWQLFDAAVAWARAGGVNLPPIVEAGPDLTAGVASPVFLRGMAYDSDALQSAWSQVSGPAGATFHPATSLATTVRLTATGTYVFRLTASDSELTGSDTVTVVVQADQPSGAPSIEPWYGDRQVFGRLGTPQRWANVLGRVADSDGIGSLAYSIDGGAIRGLSVGPDGRRLASAGDFNADLLITQLSYGEHSMVLHAVDKGGRVRTRTITVVRELAPIWALPYTAAWTSTAGITDVAQPLDGRWTTFGGNRVGIAPADTGYDRLMMIGDVTWTDYDVRVPVTFRSFDSPTCSLCGAAAFGLIANWNGHNDSVLPGSQPQQGYLPDPNGLTPTPFGTIAWWQSGAPKLTDNLSNTTSTGPSLPLVANNTYVLRLQVDAQGTTTAYRFKMWPQAQAEPATWSAQYTSPGAANEPRTGSLVLMAHEAAVEFGAVTVTRL